MITLIAAAAGLVAAGLGLVGRRHPLIVPVQTGDVVLTLSLSREAALGLAVTLVIILLKRSPR